MTSEQAAESIFYDRIEEEDPNAENKVNMYFLNP